MKPDAILQVGNFLSESMVTRHVCEDLTLHLRARDWEVLTTSDRLARVPKVIDMVRTVWRRRREYGLAHVECYSGAAFVWAELVGYALALIGKPFILTLHSGIFPTFAKDRGARVRRLFSKAAVVTSPSGYLQEQMKPYRADLRLIPNAIDIGRYPYRERKPLKPRLIWLRGFLDYYNPMMGPRVVAELVREFPELRLVMVGPDKGDGSFERTRRLAKELGVEGSVAFPGGVPKSEVPRWMDENDIFINTTTRDNTPVSVMEAMAGGLNVVSTNVEGVPYLVEDGVDGLLVDSDDVRGMAAAVRRLLLEPGLGVRLARKAREKVEGFDWGVVLPQWERVYRELLPGPVMADGRSRMARVS